MQFFHNCPHCFNSLEKNYFENMDALEQIRKQLQAKFCVASLVGEVNAGVCTIPVFYAGFVDLAYDCQRYSIVKEFDFLQMQTVHHNLYFYLLL